MPSLDLQPVDVRVVSPYKEAMDTLHVTAHTPNEQLLGEMRGYDVSLTIMPGFVERAGDRETEVQLTRLARVLFAERIRALRALQEQHLRPPPAPLRGSRLSFREELDSSSVTGTSTDGAIEVVTVGLGSWVVSVAPGTCDRLGSAGVARAATEAAQDLVAAWRETVTRLQVRRRAERDR